MTTYDGLATLSTLTGGECGDLADLATHWADAVSDLWVAVSDAGYDEVDR